MIHGLATLLACQLAGEVAVRAAGLAVPGPVLGMALMAGLLIAFPAVAQMVRDTAEGLLAHLSLLFVPAGTGVVAHLDRLGPDGPALIAALVLSTLAGLIVTVLTFAALARLTDRGG
jgi:putative effector of murein hydrolase LrgA (UPF0299 family)